MEGVVFISSFSGGFDTILSDILTLPEAVLSVPEGLLCCPNAQEGPPDPVHGEILRRSCECAGLSWRVQLTMLLPADVHFGSKCTVFDYFVCVRASASFYCSDR